MGKVGKTTDKGYCNDRKNRKCFVNLNALNLIMTLLVLCKGTTLVRQDRGLSLDTCRIHNQTHTYITDY